MATKKKAAIKPAAPVLVPKPAKKKAAVKKNKKDPPGSDQHTSDVQAWELGKSVDCAKDESQ